MEMKNLPNKTKVDLAGIQTGIDRALAEGNKAKAKHLKRNYNKTLNRSK